MNFLYNRYLRTLLAGMACVLGFAPFEFFPVPILSLAILFLVWQQSDTPRTAARQGFVFGLGLFGAGISWIYVALHDYGDMPMPLALLSTLLFAAFLALFPALAGYVQGRLRISPGLRLMVTMPSIWMLSEWGRGLIFTGFPWLATGYAETNSPLAGYAPLLGVYGVSLIAAISAGGLASMWEKRKGKALYLALTVLLMIWVAGSMLRSISWTRPHGEPFTVALVQGNIPQNLKFNEDTLVSTLETYRRLVLESNAKLTVLPETAFPMLRNEIPQNLINQLRDHAVRNEGDMLIGAFDRDRRGYYNSVFSLGMSPEQHYRKQHLVPFGEFIPLRPVLGWIINDILNIPMGDLARGERQKPLEVAGQRVAADICYEDVFGEEIIRALPEATVLVNFTNDAWYGDSHAAAQHNQISQMRALETGRMMLRATNTGMTSITGQDGVVQKQLPQHAEGVLTGTVQGYEDATPYVRWGNAAVILLSVLLLAVSRAGKRGIPPVKRAE